MTLESLARSINNGNIIGEIIGRGRKGSYSRYAYTVNPENHHINYRFIKLVSSDLAKVEAMFPDLYIAEQELSADWHTQARLTSRINAMIRQIKDDANREAAVVPFGKYKGTKVAELTDRSYVAWLASQPEESSSHLKGEIKSWLKKAMVARAQEMGIIQIGSQFIDLEDTNPEHRLQHNTIAIHNAIQNHDNIEYVAEQNDGGLWSAYEIELPVVAVGHPYYGVAYCLVVNDKARKVKGMTISIYDYEVDGNKIKANGFMVRR